MVTAETIRTLRSGLKESQAVFAKRFGVHQSTVDRWETDGLPEGGPAVILMRQLIGAQAQASTPSSQPAE